MGPSKRRHGHDQAILNGRYFGALVAVKVDTLMGPLVMNRPERTGMRRQRERRRKMRRGEERCRVTRWDEF